MSGEWESVRRNYGVPARRGGRAPRPSLPTERKRGPLSYQLNTVINLEVTATYIKRQCVWCGEPFRVTRPVPIPDRKRCYCSEGCSREGSKLSKQNSRRRANAGIPPRQGTGRPRKRTPEEAAEYRRYSKRDRFFERHPEIPRRCMAQGCGEERVVELAHKERVNQRGFTVTNTNPKTVWILCPTCHRVLDYGIETAEEMGLT